MAEFQEVMKNYERMCKEHLCTSACPMYKIGVCEKIGRCVTEYGIEKVEQTIMSWAAEHPEPVYPTWYEFLTERYHKAWEAIGCDSIPADIAQKLGVQPKEVQHGQ